MLRLSAGGDDEGSAEEELAVEFTGEPVTIAFNPGYLLDGLGALHTDEVALVVHHTQPARAGQAGGGGWRRSHPGTCTC